MCSDVQAGEGQAMSSRVGQSGEEVEGAARFAGRDRYVNRDLSWLEFNRRVLFQSVDTEAPLLERVRFHAIFASNLDEFFMKRMGLLKRLIASGVETRTPDGRTPRETMLECRTVVQELQERQAKDFESSIVPALREAGIHILAYQDLAVEDRRQIDSWFNENVFPVLTPLAVDPGHRFPFISNLSENLGIMLRQPTTREQLFARVKVPDVLPRFVSVPPGRHGAGSVTRLIPLEEVIKNNLDDLFPGMEIVSVVPFRVTRNAAIEQEDDPEDLLNSVEQELKARRFARAVRLECPRDSAPAIVDLVLRSLGLEEEDLYARGGPLEYGDFFQIADLPRADLKYDPWRPVIPARLADEEADIFSTIRERDLLVHHPYESFEASVERFIAAAARDPDVLAIKQTLYRTSPDSPFVSSLIRAAEAGKQVACLVEVRARFDESRNVRFARQLEKHGVHVAYGVVGFKTHCKCSLVVRRDPDGLRSYAHLGTGNYNPRTAQLYTDVSLLTCDPALTQDVVDLFNLLTGRSLKQGYRELIVAPYAMRPRLMELIEHEIEMARAGRGGRIIAKMNSLEDFAVTDKLYEASAAGVEILLYVRGFCCLRPGVAGLSENIRVVSVVGRFLEHSRIFHFGRGESNPLDGYWYIGSADWMYRNLNNRVEVVTPIYDREARKRLKRIFDVMARDRRRAWDMQPDGSYVKRTPPQDAAPDSPEALGTFLTLMAEAQRGS